HLAAVFPVGDVNSIERRYVARTLRLRLPTDALKHLIAGDVDHHQAVAPKRREQQPVAFDVNREVIDPPVQIAKGDLLFQLERLGREAEDAEQSESKRAHEGYSRREKMTGG